MEQYEKEAKRLKKQIHILIEEDRNTTRRYQEGRQKAINSRTIETYKHDYNKVKTKIHDQLEKFERNLAKLTEFIEDQYQKIHNPNFSNKKI